MTPSAMQRWEELEPYASPVALAAGAVMVVSAWLQWMTIQYSTGSLTLMNKVNGFSSWHGKMTVLSGIALMAATVIRRVRPTAEWRQGAAGIAIASAVVALAACTHHVLRAHPAAVTGAVLHPVYSMGIGLYLTVAGALGALAAGFFGIQPEPKVEPSSSHLPDPVDMQAGSQPR
jgi:hypothetical protein